MQTTLLKPLPHFSLSEGTAGQEKLLRNVAAVSFAVGYLTPMTCKANINQGLSLLE